MKRGLSIAAIAMISLSACSLNPFAKKDGVDYRSASAGPSLDIPPDLTTPRYDERYRGVPGAAVGGTSTATSNVLPKFDGVRIERAGSERWLVVNQKVDAVWPIVRAFWQEQGFTLLTDRADIGVVETDWLENRAKIADDPIRNVVGKVFDKLYSSGTRDKYRTRVERGPNDTTEIYVSHRGLEEVAVGRAQQGDPAGGFGWAARPADPGMEAEMLNRLMVRLGIPAAQAQQIVSASGVATPARTGAAATSTLSARATLAANVLTVDDPFDRAWRRVGLALDRVGFTVVDRDRTQGLYYVRYADERVQRETGLIDKLKFWKSDDGPQAEQYRVAVKEEGGKSSVTVQDKAGAAPQKVVSDRILALLLDQLK